MVPGSVHRYLAICKALGRLDKEPIIAQADTTVDVHDQQDSDATDDSAIQPII